MSARQRSVLCWTCVVGWFCLVGAVMMFAVDTFAHGRGGDCAAPMPAPDSTQEVWDAYLTDTLHACYGASDPLIGRTTAVTADFGHGASLSCLNPDAPTCQIIIERSYLAQAPSPRHVATMLGHEASHALEYVWPRLRELRPEVQEFAADAFAALPFPDGECVVKDNLTWQYEVDLEGLEPDDDRRSAIAQRWYAMRARCALLTTDHK